MRPLIHQRCFNHSLREAVACCPGCSRFYCRECVTEHEDRILCAACLKKLAQKSSAGKRGFAGLARLAQCAAGVFLAWLFFYLCGQALLSIDSSFHEGTIWQGNWMDEP